MSMPNMPNLRGAVDLSALTQRAEGRAPGEAASSVAPGTQIPVPSLVIEGNDANFTAILDLSNQVPVIVNLWDDQSPQCAELTPVLKKLVSSFAGRLLLVEVDVASSPQLAQAFQVQAAPTVAAVLAGRPLPLFAGVAGEADIHNVFEQVLELAAQNGVAGIARPQDGGLAEDATPPVESKPIPPLHQEAYDAAEAGNYPAAITAWEKALKANPADSEAQAGLAQIRLLHRLQGKTMSEVRDAAAKDSTNVQAQLDVADLDLSGGHIEDAFDRLLTLYPQVDQPGKDVIRERLLELFEVVGVSDPVVNAARARLTNLLY